MTNTTNTAPLSAEELDKLEELAQAATPGPWQVLTDEHPTYAEAYAHKERRIFTSTANPQLGAIYPIVNSSRGIAQKKGDQAIWMVSIEETNADFIAAANPATILALIAQARLAAQPVVAPIKTWQDRVAEQWPTMKGTPLNVWAQLTCACEEIKDLRADLAAPVAAQADTTEPSASDFDETAERVAFDAYMAEPCVPGSKVQRWAMERNGGTRALIWKGWKLRAKRGRALATSAGEADTTASVSAAAQAVEARPDVLDMVLDVVRLAHDAMDDTGDNEQGELVWDKAGFDALSAAIEKLEALPDDQPGYVMGPAAKARWAMRIPATSAGEADTTASVSAEETTAKNAAVRFDIASFAQASAAPADGWKLVPVEPTSEMIEAFEGELTGASGSYFDWSAGADEGYAAMLAASPEPATAEVPASDVQTLNTNAFDVQKSAEVAHNAAQPVEQPADDARDAARYRLLATRFGQTTLPCFLEGHLTHSYVADGKESIDAAIDAAIQASKGATDGAGGGAE